MRSSTYLALLAGSAAAQSTVSLFNLYEVAKTLVQIGSDATATTYTKSCPSGKVGILASDLPTPSGPASASITPAPRPRFARQVESSARGLSTSSAGDSEEGDFCEQYTLKQGASTWSFGFKDPTPGLWTVNLECKWQGAITDADMTCTGGSEGSFVDTAALGTSTSVIPKAEISSMEAIQAVTIITATGAAVPSQTPSGTATPSKGLGPAGPLPTGAMALVAGAAGVFAAALAL
ncbi:hypothetical protein DE146DRAFT_454926 [Phaeosphaeria sp. MPI-PUGE-AT-0046c]|nr:hypothetical protein DE146DRAFT_454926 [Phaeosphaeria sp. MPI-PUGE-AT-0046c]